MRYLIDALLIARNRTKCDAVNGNMWDGQVPSVRYYVKGDYTHDVTNIPTQQGYKAFLAAPSTYRTIILTPCPYDPSTVHVPSSTY